MIVKITFDTKKCTADWIYAELKDSFLEVTMVLKEENYCYFLISSEEDIEEIEYALAELEGVLEIKEMDE